MYFFFFFQAEDGIRDGRVTGVQTCALPISSSRWWDAAVVCSTTFDGKMWLATGHSSPSSGCAGSSRRFRKETGRHPDPDRSLPCTRRPAGDGCQLSVASASARGPVGSNDPPDRVGALTTENWPSGPSSPDHSWEVHTWHQIPRFIPSNGRSASPSSGSRPVASP